MAKILELKQKGVEIEVKRFYIPFKVTAKCPKCGKDNEADLDDQYLSYPILGEPESVYFTCYEEDGGCEEEYTVDVILGLTLKLAK